jgi:predicted  nucleic acid-binding Zn-ribbon protein
MKSRYRLLEEMVARRQNKAYALIRQTRALNTKHIAALTTFGGVTPQDEVNALRRETKALNAELKTVLREIADLEDEMSTLLLRHAETVV